MHACRLHSINTVGDCNIVVGQVLCIHVEEAIVDNFKIDRAAIRRWGGLPAGATVPLAN